ncbi:MAG: polysaccharide biosynthesis protein [Muribaculaceae bacterium]|nr:polysaccharide biosynthesis protein [Muribaculaceae bacterium]
MKSIKSLAKWYFSKAALPYWGILLLDCIIVMLAGFSIYMAMHGVNETMTVFSSLSCTLCVFLICYVISFRVFHTYDGVIRYSSFRDLMRVSEAVLVALALIFIFQFAASMAGAVLVFGILEIVLMALVVVVCMTMARVWVKTLYEKFSHPANRTRTFIFGINEGVALAKNINSSESSRFEVCGFVTESVGLTRRRLMGMKVYSFDETLPDNMLKEGSKTLVVPPQFMNALRANERIVDVLADSGVKVLVMPDAREWNRGNGFNISDLHPINVEDLLPREKICIDLQSASELIEGHTVMITGAAGSIGSEMVGQIARFKPSRMVLIDQAETPMHDIRLMLRRTCPEIAAETIVGNIADDIYMERLFRMYRPEYVFHAAAYKHVPMMEDNPYESVVNNIKGTKIIADLAVKYSTKKFVMVSTDKAVNPTNVMGCSKRICEIYVQSLDRAIKDGAVEGGTQFVTTRFGNVLGSNGSVIPLFQEQIRNGGPVTVTHPDIIRYFMLIPEACKLVIEAGTMGKGGEIFVFDMGQPVKIVELAQRMIRLSGAKDVEIRFTGLRDGEKLYEEVLTSDETTLPTFHPKIKIAKVREYGFDEVSRAIDELIECAATMDDMGIVAKMKRIVPEFKSHQSKYEALDRSC